MKLISELSVIIPAYNESENIIRNIEIVIQELEKIVDDYEIVIIDDGSKDGTYTLVREMFIENDRVNIYKNPKNLGKGAAIRKGINYANKYYTVLIDADLDLHPRQIKRLFGVLYSSKADIVIGSKFHPDSDIDYPVGRGVMSLIYFMLIKLLFKLPCRDTQTGLKLFKTKVLKDVLPLQIDRFAYDLEILVKANNLGYEILESPIILNSQRKFNRIGLKGIFFIIWDTLRVWINKQRGYYVKDKARESLKNRFGS